MKLLATVLCAFVCLVAADDLLLGTLDVGLTERDGIAELDVESRRKRDAEDVEVTIEGLKPISSIEEFEAIGYATQNIHPDILEDAFLLVVSIFE